MKTLRTEIAELSYDEEEHLLYIRILENAELDLEKTRIHYETIRELTEDEPHAAIIDSTHYFSIDPETLRYTAQPEVIGKRLAAAHYNVSAGNSLTLDFFVKTHKPLIPVKKFATREEAVKWARQFMRKR
ncbi:MAG: hypothetical protein AB1458_06015 [Bacteroidota bacterium]